MIMKNQYKNEKKIKKVAKKLAMIQFAFGKKKVKNKEKA